MTKYLVSVGTADVMIDNPRATIEKETTRIVRNAKTKFTRAGIFGNTDKVVFVSDSGSTHVAVTIIPES